MNATHLVTEADLASIPCEFDAPAAAAPVYTPRPVHPFQRLGLGKAPFTCVAVDDAGSRDEHCQFCTTAIRYVYHIRGADGSQFQVGSECVKQTGGEVAGFETFNRQMNARVRQLQGEARKAREASKAQAAAQAWREEHAAEVAYMQKRADSGNGFYQYLLSTLERFGSLYDSKLASVRGDMAREVARPAAAPVVNLEPVHAAFAKAAAAGVHRPTLRLAGFVFNLAPSTGNNPGAIYVKQRMPAGDMPGAYLGKVLGGKFFASRECDAAAQAEVVAVSQDPKAAAVAYGKTFGRCSVCNRELTDAESVANGIGPVCAAKYGF